MTVSRTIVKSSSVFAEGSRCAARFGRRIIVGSAAFLGSFIFLSFSKTIEASPKESELFLSGKAPGIKRKKLAIYLNSRSSLRRKKWHGRPADGIGVAWASCPWGSDSEITGPACGMQRFGGGVGRNGVRRSATYDDDENEAEGALEGYAPAGG